MNALRSSKSLDPDEARRFVGHDLGHNCLKMLPAGGKRVDKYIPVQSQQIVSGRHRPTNKTPFLMADGGLLGLSMDVIYLDFVGYLTFVHGMFETIYIL